MTFQAEEANQFNENALTGSQLLRLKCTNAADSAEGALDDLRNYQVDCK